MLLVQNGITLVFEGATVGLMGGSLTPSCPRRRRGHRRRSAARRSRDRAPRAADLHVVDTMHERKQRMADLSDAFDAALPGGLGTLDELFEIYTWAQLGLHRKPIGLMSIEGYFDGLVGFLEHAVADASCVAGHRDMLIVEREPAPLERLKSFDPASLTPKWIDRQDM